MAKSSSKGAKPTGKRDRAGAAERIVKLNQGIVTLVNKHEDPFLDVPSRTLCQRKGVRK